jgi:HlyD family secretion protein
MRVTKGGAIGALAAVAAVAGVVWSVMPRPIPVEAAAVTKGRFIATVDEDGKTRLRERYLVAAPLAGRLARIQLKVGDRVAAGSDVATILPSPEPLLDPRSRREAEERVGAAEAALERARFLVERARIQNDQALSDLERTRTLMARGAATVVALEHAEAAARLADRDVRAAELHQHAALHELGQTQSLLMRFQGGPYEMTAALTVTAPIAGAVLRVMQESETIVQPGAALIEIGDPHDIEIVVDVLSTDAVEIRPGADVTIEGWGGPRLLTGRVRRVEPAAFTKVSTLGIEEQRVNVIIDLTSPPEAWAGVGDGYHVDARITVLALPDAIIVPAGALFRRGETWTVFAVEAGRAAMRPVTLARRSGRFAAVERGLDPGEAVIVYPSDRVAAGVRVAPR